MFVTIPWMTKYNKVVHLRDIRGFSLVELMVVIAIISLLTAIAVPAFLGQREKAKVRATSASAVSAVADLQGYLDWYVAGEPYMILTDVAGTQGCFEVATPVSADQTCAAVFNQAGAGTYPVFPGGLATVISHFISHHTFKGDVSAFTGSPLFVSASPGDGQILLSPMSSNIVVMLAYATNSTSPIFSQIQMVTIR
ncbi:MAG: prepilin-type N-terminal cleavage/methylation domain-containing protein [Nitrospirae bacterium]|nr:prepilin-type N-terminal cleavage/methylation domain-containing protein [Nitrospirota bacterium]